jgi:hypothetical protein
MFESLNDALRNEELILIDGGFCHYHLRRDGQLTIREIISTKSGSGKKMLDILKTKGGQFIFAKCPVDLDSNGWYFHMGFNLIG